MHAPTDFAHATAVERILRANGVASTQSGSGERFHHGDSPMWGHGPAPAVGRQELGATCPQCGGC
jgi:hypothetical protein